MSEGTYLYTLTQETRELSKYKWKVEKVLYDDAAVEKLMEQANKYFLKIITEIITKVIMTTYLSQRLRSFPKFCWWITGS